MTHNQIDYWSMRENVRANKAKEAENIRHNEATERLEMFKQNETGRHNLAQETEDRRHDVQSEYISGRQLDESKRHNVVTEGETVRSAMAQEDIKRQSNVISGQSIEASKLASLRQMQVGLANVNLGWANLDELNRHQGVTENIAERNLNLDTEKLYEQSRHNVAGEEEVHRHNVVTEVTNGVTGVGRIASVVLPFIK